MAPAEHVIQMPDYSTYTDGALRAERDALQNWLQTADAPSFQVASTRRNLRAIEAEMTDRDLGPAANDDEARYSTTHHDGKVHLVNDPKEIDRYIAALHRYHDGQTAQEPTGFAHHIDRPIAVHLARQVQTERRAAGKPYREVWVASTWHGEEQNLAAYRQRGLRT
jgi:hypothetical protein